MVTLLEFIFQGFFEWIYGLILEIWNYFSSSLLGVMSLDFAYLKTHIPIMGDIQQVLLAVGWALLLGNLVFQALRSMASGLGFEGEDPKLLFARTFVFGFLLLASPQICEMILGITSRVIAVIELPDAINVQLVDGSVIGVFSAAWLLVIIFDLITMFMVFSLLLEVAERYVVLAMLTVMAPLAFAMGGSKSTSEIFTGWCRMFGSMCFLMAANIVFFKMLLSVVSTVPSFPDVFLWMVLIVSIVKVAKKADEIITRIGLNPAITGNRSSLPGVIAYTVFRTALSMVTKGAANSVGGALGFTGKAAAGAGKGAAGLAGTLFGGAGGAAGAAGAAAGVATGGIGAVAGAAAGGIGGAAAQAAGQRSERPRNGGGRTQTQQTSSQQEHTQQNTSQTQAGSQQQTTTREAESRTAGPQGVSRPDSSTRRSSVQQGAKRAPSYVTPPGRQAKTEENSTSHSSSFSNTARGGGFSGSSRGGGGSFSGSAGDTPKSSGFSGFSGPSRGGGFTKDNARGGGGSFNGSSRGGGFTKDTARGGGFSSSATQKETATQENTSRSNGFGGSFASPSRGGGFGGSSTKNETTQENTTRSSGTSGVRGGGFSGSSRGGGFSKDSTRGGGFGGTFKTGSSSTAHTSSSENATTATNTSQSGTAGTGTRSSHRPAGSEPRHSRNIPPAASMPTSGTQRSGPAQQEQRRTGAEDKPTGKGGAPVPRPGTAGTGTPSATGRAVSGASDAQQQTRSTRRNQGKPPAQRTGSSLKPQMLSSASGSQSGTAGTGTRSSQRPADPEPRYSRNVPPATAAPSSGAQRSGPVQQEQRRADVKDKSTGKGGAPVPRPGTAGTGPGHRTPPGQKLSGGSSTSKPDRQTNREGGTTSV